MSDERTSREIVDGTNELARRLLLHLGYRVPDDYRCYRNDHPRAALAWAMAVEAVEFCNGDEIEDALGEIEEEEREKRELAIDRAPIAFP